MFDFGVSLVTLTGTVNLHFFVERTWLCKFSHTADLNHGGCPGQQAAVPLLSGLVFHFVLLLQSADLFFVLLLQISWSVLCLAA